jgi:Flp pilus assembly protein TadD
MKRNADVRVKALWFVGAAVMALGLVLAFASGQGIWLRSTPSPARQHSEPSQSAETAHARDMRGREIAERFEQAKFMLHAGQYDYAVTALHRLLQLAPNMPEAHANMGFAFLGQQRYMVARDFFRSAIDLQPQQANAYYGLAVALESLCNVPAAIVSMRTYLHLSTSKDRFADKARAALGEWQSVQRQRAARNTPDPRCVTAGSTLAVPRRNAIP